MKNTQIEFFCTFSVLEITKQDRVGYRTTVMLRLLHFVTIVYLAVNSGLAETVED